MTKKEFEIIVHKALDSLPKEFADKLQNLEIVTEDKSPRDGKTLLLGLYQGVPLDKRGHYYAGVLPDKITLYQKNIETVCRNEKDMILEIQKTLLHELGHYFGISEKRLCELGY